MAIKHKIIADGAVDLLVKVGEWRTPEGNVISYDHIVKSFGPGDIVEDSLVDNEVLSPVVIQAYDKGEKHIRSLIVRVDEKGEPVDEVPEAEVKEQSEPVTVKSAGGAASTAVKETTPEAKPAPKPAEKQTAAKQ